MSGSFDINGYTPTLAGSMLPIGVYLYDGEGSFTLLPNVWCTYIGTQEGPAPPTARFKYAQDGAYEATLGWPARVEQLWPIDAQGPYVVMPDDRLVVMAQNPDGSNFYLFDGFAQIPQADMTSGGEPVTFAAVGVAARCYDDVIHGRVQRDADTPEDTSGDSDYYIHLPCRFNPADDSARGVMAGYQPNATVAGLMTEDEELGNYPVFLGTALVDREDSEETTYLEYWSVPDAVRYLLAQPDPGDDYVTWPTLASIASLLETIAPAEGTDVLDDDSPTADLTIRDYDASNKPMVEVLADLMGYAGFLMAWQLDADNDGLPMTYLKFYRRDEAAAGSPKSLYLQPVGSGTVDPSQTNINQVHLARDCNGIVNAWRVETAVERVEVTVELAPFFQPQAGDEQASSTPTEGRGRFLLANLTNASAEDREAYRWYVADECGDGHWNALTQEQSFQPMDLSPVMPNTAANTKSYCTRYRPGSRTLIATDSDGNPLKAVLQVQSVANTYSQDPYILPGPVDGTLTTITNGWELLPDRLGIRVTVDDPENWVTGATSGVTKIQGITQQTLAGTDGVNPFILYLTTVIEKDHRARAKAPKRTASPTVFTRTRSADAKDVYIKAEISVGSINYPALQESGLANGTDPYIARDDTALAVAHAEQLRSASEMPKTAGSVPIPFITDYYGIGDRIDQVAGRDINFQTNIAVESGENPTYPWIVSVGYVIEENRQQTVLHLSDMRHAPDNWR